MNLPRFLYHSALLALLAGSTGPALPGQPSPATPPAADQDVFNPGFAPSAPPAQPPTGVPPPPPDFRPPAGPPPNRGQNPGGQPRMGPRGGNEAGEDWMILERFLHMSPDKIAKMRAFLDKLESMTPEQKAELVAQFREMRRMSETRRQALLEQMKQLSPEERAGAMRHFFNLSPEARAAEQEKIRQMSPEERTAYLRELRRQHQATPRAPAATPGETPPQ